MRATQQVLQINRFGLAFPRRPPRPLRFMIFIVQTYIWPEQ